MTDVYRCPRRGEPFAFQPNGGPDNFDKGRCSYCGSVSGDAYREYVRLGGPVTPTDKAYKVYLWDAETLKKANGGKGGSMADGAGKFYFPHLNA